MVTSSTPLNATNSYLTKYDECITMYEKTNESIVDLKQTADNIIRGFGLGRTLIIDSGEGLLVESLLRRGVDAYGLDMSGAVVSNGNQKFSSRFFQSSALSLPFDDESFQTIVATHCIGLLAPKDIPIALKELHRVTGRYAFLTLVNPQYQESSCKFINESRAWWESKCYEAGFRKHPAYYKINPYESLNHDVGEILIPLEKISQSVNFQYPLTALEEERGLHMDMTRDFGERSDAHIIRYQWACNYIKPGDRVLDAACGLGYGSHVIKHLTRAKKIIGIDGSNYAIEYARTNFSCSRDRVEYKIGMLPDILSTYPDCSFDTIISFETLEHVEAPASLLSEFHRLLVPGGRVIVSVPNDWSDETGEDPNPFHLHVYDWKRLRSELSENFILEEAFAQTASQCKNTAVGNHWEPRHRSLHSVVWGENSPTDCEWWLMTAMKSPLEIEAPYHEQVFSNISDTEHPSICYAKYFINPWLMHSIVNSEYRIKNLIELEKLTIKAMEIYPSNSNDFKAALCVRAYQYLKNNDKNQINRTIVEIDRIPCTDPENPMDLRWRVSLLYIKGKLLEASGELVQAQEIFSKCSSINIHDFGIHLSTKTTEAAYLAGKIAYSLGKISEAKRCWQYGIEIGNTLLKIELTDVLINSDFPNLFNHGDGIREYTVAWDNIARCANGLHLLHHSDSINYATLDNCHQTEYSGVTADLVATRQTLVHRTKILERTSSALEHQTKELVQIRQALVQRTEMLEHASGDLQERTQDLIHTRQVLIERTELLERANHDLQSRTEELILTRQTLVERTEILEQTNNLLASRTKELNSYLSNPFYRYFASKK